MNKEFDRMFAFDADKGGSGGESEKKVAKKTKLIPPTPKQIDDIIRLRSGDTHQYLPMAHDRNWRRYPDSKKQETVVVYSGTDMPGKRFTIPWIEVED